MPRRLLTLLLLIFSSSLAVADERLSNGTLQAYWHPYWDVDTHEYQPDLQIRYIDHRDDDQPRRIIDIHTAASEASLEAFIHQHFDHLPDTFFTYKEGYANQPGTAIVPRVRRYVECDSLYYEARLISFTADHHSPISDQDTLKDEEFAGCGDRHPYMASYAVKEGVSTALKSAPNEGGRIVHSLGEGELITRIKSIDSEWIYASLYSNDIPIRYPETKGYIRLKDLTPVD